MKDRYVERGHRDGGRGFEDRREVRGGRRRYGDRDYSWGDDSDSY